jgi:UV excision repair protein RAD23
VTCQHEISGQNVSLRTRHQVLALKMKIESTKPELSLAVDRQKLIHAGKVLKDDQTVSSLGISETDFIVCMVSKEVAKVITATISTTI